MQAVSATSTNTIYFTGEGGGLILSSPALDADENFLPVISGFDSSDVIDLQGTVTDASYDDDILTLLNNGAVVAKLDIGPGYNGDSFDTIPVANGVTQVDIGPKWLNPVSGNFSTAADWSTGKAPGGDDSVAISANAVSASPMRAAAMVRSFAAPPGYIVSWTKPTKIHSLIESSAAATLAIAEPGQTETVTSNMLIKGVMTLDAASGGGGTTLKVGGVFENEGSVTIGNSSAGAVTTF